MRLRIEKKKIVKTYKDKTWMKFQGKGKRNFIDNISPL